MIRSFFHTMALAYGTFHVPYVEGDLANLVTNLCSVSSSGQKLERFKSRDIGISSSRLRRHKSSLVHTWMQEPLNYRKHFFLPLFAVITIIGIFENYTAYASFYSMCFGFGSLPPLATGTFGGLVLLNCNNAFDVVFGTIWIWFILVLGIGVISLGLTSYSLMKRNLHTLARITRTETASEIPH